MELVRWNMHWWGIMYDRQFSRFCIIRTKRNTNVVQTYCFVHREVLVGNFEMFPLVRESCIKKMSPIVFQHLTTLEEKFNSYFPSLKADEYDWVRNPFIESSSNTGLLLCEEEELACISGDRGLKIKHAEVPIDTFWIPVKEEYPSLAKKALTSLMQFSTSYLCELGFSTLHNIKSKEREQYVVLKKKWRFVSLKYVLTLKPLPKSIKHMYLTDRFVALLS